MTATVCGFPVRMDAGEYSVRIGRTIVSESTIRDLREAVDELLVRLGMREDDDN